MDTERRANDPRRHDRAAIVACVIVASTPSSPAPKPRTAHCTLGRRGNNPFCYHRAKTLERRGIRERLVQRGRAPQEPYDFGVFELVEEPIAAGDDAAKVPAGEGTRVRLPVVE